MKNAAIQRFFEGRRTQCNVTESAKRGFVTAKVTARGEHISEGVPRVTESDEYVVRRRGNAKKGNEVRSVRGLRNCDE